MGLGQFMQADSFRYAQASVLAPFRYSNLLWAMLLGALEISEHEMVRDIEIAIIAVRNQQGFGRFAYITAPDDPPRQGQLPYPVIRASTGVIADALIEECTADPYN